MPGWVREALLVVLLVVAVVLVVIGVALIHAPAGFITAGILTAALAFVAFTEVRP